MGEPGVQGSQVERRVGLRSRSRCLAAVAQQPSQSRRGRSARRWRRGKTPFKVGGSKSQGRGGRRFPSGAVLLIGFAATQLCRVGPNNSAQLRIRGWRGREKVLGGGFVLEEEKVVDERRCATVPRENAKPSDQLIIGLILPYGHIINRERNENTYQCFFRGV